MKKYCETSAKGATFDARTQNCLFTQRVFSIWSNGSGLFDPHWARHGFSYSQHSNWASR